MAKEVRFGIVGLGMGRNRAEKAARTPGARLVAVCDIWEERGRKAVESLGCEWLPDFDAMLARDDIDAIGVFTPSGTHASFAKRALEAGKHAFTTKPMDIRLSAADAAIAAAEKRGLILAVDFESRYSPANHQIREALGRGAIGRPVCADLRMKWYRGQDYYDGGMPGGWRSRRSTEGGSLANQAVHYLDLIQWWLGPVKAVTGRKGTFGHFIETEDASCSVLQFESGAMGMLLTTTCSFPDLGTAIEISGTRGTIAWKDQEIAFFRAMKASDAKTGDPTGYVRPEYATKPEPVDILPSDYPVPEGLPGNIIEDMVAAITSNRPVACDGREGRKTVEIIEAVYRSSDTGQTVWLR